MKTLKCSMRDKNTDLSYLSKVEACGANIISLFGMQMLGGPMLTCLAVLAIYLGSWRLTFVSISNPAGVRSVITTVAALV